MNYETYEIRKEKTDLLSSLKALNKNLIKKVLKEKYLDNINELKTEVLDTFTFCLSLSKDDMATKIYFKTLLDNENTNNMPGYQSDIKDFFVFIYKNDDHYSYYVPDEIKKIIKRELKI